MGKARSGSINTHSAGNPARPISAPLLVRLDAPDVPPVRLNRALTIVGSKGHSHVRIMSRAISGSHAVLLNLGNNVFVRDLMSRTHTYVNERQVSECRLKYGDVLRFGEMQFRFTDTNLLRQSISSVASSPASLLLENSQQSRALQSPVFVIGRNRGADLHLDRAQISKVHAVVFQRPDGHVLRSLSRYDTRVNGQPVRLFELKDRDTIEIGGFHFRYLTEAVASGIQEDLDFVPLGTPHGAAEQVPPIESGRDVPATAREGDFSEEHYVFAPEPEILSEPRELESAPGDNLVDRIESKREFSSGRNTSPPSDHIWHFQPPPVAEVATNVESSVDGLCAGLAKSADDLIEWGIASGSANAEIARHTDAPEPPPSAHSAPAIRQEAPPKEEPPPNVPRNDTITLPSLGDGSPPGWKTADPTSEAEVAKGSGIDVASSTSGVGMPWDGAIPMLSEPVDLETLAKVPPTVFTASITSAPIASTPKTTGDVRDSISAADPPASPLQRASRRTLEEGPSKDVMDIVFPGQSSGPGISILSPLVIDPAGLPLRAVDEILANEVISLASPARQGTFETRWASSRFRLWIAASVIVLVVAAGIILWLHLAQ